MKLSIIRDGVKHPYSEQQFRLDNPATSFPRGLAGVELTSYGISIEPEEVKEQQPERKVTEKIIETVREQVVIRSVPPDPAMVPMHCFLWGIREFGLRVQFERYILAQEGHARDYWFTAPYVSRVSTYVQHAKSFFMLKDSDLDAIFTTANSIEE